MDKPKYGQQYSLTGGAGQPAISNGNTWEESRIKTREEIIAQIPLFIEVAQGLQEPQGDINYRSITYKLGPKYAKVISGHSVFCFIDLATGNILKAESWSKPALHARGNIFSEDNGASAINKYGANYLK